MRSVAEKVLAGGGEAGALARSVDWSKTAIGPVDGWSQALRSAAALVLHSHSQMLLWWGPEFVQIYNDAYRPVLGDKHPRAMGQPFRECWAEVFDILGPMAERPFRGGPASTADDIPLLIDRKVRREESHFRLAYSPVPDETVEASGIGGVLATVTEITEQVYGTRQLRTLRELAAGAAAEMTGVEQACQSAAAALAQNRFDVPFALFYLLAEDGRSARLAASAGFDAPGIEAPADIDLSAGAPSPWRLREVADARRVVVVESLASIPFALPRSPWAEPPREAIVLPLASREQATAYGVLVCGVSPHRMLDADYRGFFELAAGEVVTAIRNVRALEAERRRNEALAEIDRAKTVFFSNVSHEFRTPLTLMLGLQQDALESDQETLSGESLQIVHRNTLRLLKLVNSLLEFSRIEAGRAQPSYQPTDLAAVTRELASTFRSAMERGGLRFEVDCSALPALVHVDRDMWEKIVLNLLSNAFKFTLRGSVTVRQRPDGDRVTLEVSDSGVGIPAADLPRVFDRFHRVEGSQGRTHEGTGIGLALVRDMVALHGGTVEVTSRMGAGTAFRVAVPFGSAHLPSERVIASPPLSSAAAGAAPFVSEALRWLPPETAAPATHSGGEPPEPREPARILIVDDNADMREYLVRLLGRHWTVDVATDGVQALARIEECRPDLVLTDAMMPNMDGFALLRAIRGDPRTAALPVVVLSARAGEESRVDGLNAGVDDYLVKPFAAKELLARIHASLERTRLRRAAEAERNRLRSLLSQVPAIVNFLRGTDLVVEYAHPKTVEALKGRMIVGKPLVEAVPEFRDQEYPALLRRVMETGEPYQGTERPVLLDDGLGGLAETYWNFVYLPVRDERGEVEGVMTFDLEVTDQVRARRKIEEQARLLREATREAEQARHLAETASRAKDEFLAMLGHELRNPLSPIVAALQLMKLRGLGGREQSVIERQVRHLVRLVDDLMDVSRITKGKIELRKRRIEMSEIVLHGLEIASPLLEQRRIKVDVSVPAGGLPVEADPDRLAQVVANLLTNSAKYSEPETSVSVVAAGVGGRIRLTIRDQGIGIDPALLGRIFDLFFQQPQSLDRAKGGLGLGLAIVRSLVELHGGTVVATSDGVGRGSEFVVELPLARAASAADTAPGRPAANGAQRGKRILLVDDNADVTNSLGALLRELGHEVQTAAEGIEALKIATMFKPEICLLDIGLPAMDGYELAKRLRGSNDLPERARIVAITGYGQPADMQRSTEAGFDGHLVKPVDTIALSQALAG
jgi:signal transduction histidine kinase/DNA-binding response OmpR family regulator